MVNLGIVRDYLGYVGGSSFGFSSLEVGGFDFANVSSLGTFPSLSLDLLGFGVGVSIGRSFYGSLFAPTFFSRHERYEYDKLRAGITLLGWGDSFPSFSPYSAVDWMFMLSAGLWPYWPLWL